MLKKVFIERKSGEIIVLNCISQNIGLGTNGKKPEAI